MVRAARVWMRGAEDPPHPRNRVLSASTKELLDVAKEPLLAVKGGRGGGNAGRFQGEGADAGKVTEAVAAAAAALEG